MALVKIGNLKGPQGDQGDAGTFVSASAESVAASEEPEAIIGGTPAASTVHFRIPKGERGLPGVNAVPADEAVAAYAADPESATGRQLEYSIGAVSESLDGRLGLVGFKAALAQRDTNPVDIVFAGDSITEGYGAGSPEYRWISQVVADLRTRAGVAGGGAYIPAWYASPDMEAAGGVALSGNAVKSSPMSAGLGLRAARLGADTGSGLGAVTYTGVTGTSFRIFARQFSDVAGTNTVRIYIDGVSVAEWAVNTGAETVTRDWALTEGPHTIKLEARFGAPVIEGIYVFDGDEASGIRIWDGGKSGSRADQFTTAAGGTDRWLSSVAVINPDLVVIGWGTNDYSSKTPAEYEVALRGVADSLRSTVPNVPLLFLAMYERGSEGVAPWGEYVSTMRTVAGSYDNASMIDIGQTIPKLAGDGGADPYGLLSDLVHPNPVGHKIIADRVAGVLMPN